MDICALIPILGLVMFTIPSMLDFTHWVRTLINMLLYDQATTFLHRTQYPDKTTQPIVKKLTQMID